MPKHSTLAAYAALFVSLGGTGYAAVSLAPNTVGTNQIRNGSVHTRDLARTARPPSRAKIADVVTAVVTDPTSPLNIAVHASDGATGPQGPQGDVGAPSDVAGPIGPQGDPGIKGDHGDQGPAGTQVGRGFVGADGSASLDYLTIATHSNTGAYCFTTDKSVLGSAKAATVTLADNTTGVDSVSVTKDPTSGACDGKDWGVTLLNGGAGVDHAFYIIVG